MYQTTRNTLREAALGLVSVRMSKVAFHLDYVTYPPLILFCLWFGHWQVTVWLSTLLFAFGLFLWTLAEYLLHRFVLHAWPYFAKFHQAHHDEPRAMIAAPTIFSMGIFGAIAYLPAALVLSPWVALPWFAGFLSGYVAFGAIHEIVHHAEGQGPMLRHFKLLHARHHHGKSGRNFGVLTSFWDRVFGTYEDPRRKRA